MKSFVKFIKFMPALCPSMLCGLPYKRGYGGTWLLLCQPPLGMDWLISLSTLLTMVLLRDWREKNEEGVEDSRETALYQY